MKRLPIDLSLITKSAKVTPAAWERAIALKTKFDVRVSDIVSICLLYMPEEEIARIVAEQNAAIENLPKPIQNLLKNVDELSPEDKAMLRDLLS